MKTNITLLLSLALTLLCNNALSFALMPYPESIESRDGNFIITNDFNIYLENSNASEEYHHNFIRRLSKQTGISIKSPFTKDKQQASLIINLKDKRLLRAPQLGDSENYQLSVSPSSINIEADNYLGAINALETLLQLIDSESHSIPAVAIVDSPRFAWRGLLIDSVRHFIPAEVIKRQLRGMSSAKLNVFHWHLTDDQGWRIESKSYPKLHKLASDGDYYSQEEIREVVAYASSLGIRVVPEFDIPGHASAIAVAYPELMSKPGPYKMETEWGVFTPLLDPSNPESYIFIDALVSELSELFPDQYMHIGGDEINPEHWESNDKIIKFMQSKNISNSVELHAYFNLRIEKILTKHNKIMIGWDEIFDKNLSKNVVVQSWQGLDSLAKTADSGHKSLLSAGFYIDQPQATAYHYRNELLPSENPEIISLSSAWESWEFTMPRLKGSAVEAVVTLSANLGKSSSNNYSGYIDIKGRDQKIIHDISRQKDKLSFSLDTWMGPLQARFTIDQKNLSGVMLVGNTPYPISGQLIGADNLAGTKAPSFQQPLALTEKQQQNIIGGEATIWSEMIDQNNIDLRIWPRTYAIAERFWSPKNINDTDDMYRRLEQIDIYSQVSVGLNHKIQQQQILINLIGANEDITPLLILSEAVEQTQYYTRHHLKYRAGNYHGKEPLNKFVDSLPAESNTLVRLNNIIDLNNTNCTNINLKVLKVKLREWIKNTAKLSALIDNNKTLNDIGYLANEVNRTATIALAVISHIEGNILLSPQKLARLHTELQEISAQKGEVVTSSALLAIRLIDVCTNN